MNFSRFWKSSVAKAQNSGRMGYWRSKGDPESHKENHPRIRESPRDFAKLAIFKSMTARKPVLSSKMSEVTSPST